MTLPLQGIRVVELCVWVAGPTCTRVLGELGADVIKVENPKGGDPGRSVITEKDEHDTDLGLSPHWELWNGSKRSVAIDLRQDEGKEIILKLLKAADVFITNLRPGAIDRLTLDYENVAKINPGIIYAQNSGFGLKGPDRDRSAFDSNAFWTRSGIMSTMGQPDAPPVALRGAMGDLTTAIFLSGAVGMALLARERFGFGQKVDISLMSSGMWVAGEDIQQRLILGEHADNSKHSRKKMPNPLWNTYRTKDKQWLELILLETDRFWPQMCKAIEREDLEKDQRFDSESKRAKNSQTLTLILDEILATKTLEEWAERFDRYGLVWEAETSISEVLSDSQVSENDYVAEVTHSSGSTFKLLRIPFQLGKTSILPRSPAPELGQHTREILQEIGYEEGYILNLKKKGVIA